MNNYPWLQQSTAKWVDLVRNKRVPHAILLSGTRGVGKIAFAHQMAHIALCENLSETGICNQCFGCELVKAGNHTDLTVITAEKSIIKVAQIRQLSKNVTLTASRNQYKVVIIENAEQMNKAAENALLKTLEEPPQKVVIVLTTNEIGKLLPTIKSRCIKVTVNTPDFAVTQKWLENSCNATIQDINLSLSLVNAAPIAAKTILMEDKIGQIKQMLSDLQLLKNRQKTVLEIAKQWFSEGWFIDLHYIAAYLLDNLKESQNIQSNANIYFSQAASINVLGFIRKIHQFTQMLKTPLKVELMLENLLIEWQALSSQ